MSELGLGTATFASGYGLAAEALSVDAAAALVRDAIAAGIRYVDTAAGYGMAESVIGRAAREIEDRGVRVCTKLSAAHVASRGAVAAVRESLALLRVEAVDTLLLHSVDASALDRRDLAARLEEVREHGLAARTGASTYGAPDALAALAQPWCGALQVEHSVLNPSVVAALSRHPRRAEIVARSVLCKGLLTSRRHHAGAFSAEIAPTLDALERLAAEWGWSLAELAIRFALDTPGVDVVVVGVSTPAELKTALAAAARPPLDADALALLARFDRSTHDAAHPERWPTSLERA